MTKRLKRMFQFKSSSLQMKGGVQLCWTEGLKAQAQEIKG